MRLFGYVIFFLYFCTLKFCARMWICAYEKRYGIEIIYENIRLYITRWGLLHQLGL